MNWQAQTRAPGTILRRAIMMLSALAGLLATTVTGAAQAAERVALVIGNSAYAATSELRNPRNDAEAVAAALTRLGFRVVKGIDADQASLRRLVRTFSHDIETASIALFFYAGHGLQLNGKNYMIPVDARLESEADVDFEAMDVNFVLRQMERKDRINIVLLDACRNNPLTAKLARNMGERSAFVGRGLARMETGVGTFIGFATQPENVALDGEGANSPFTLALLKHIETPGLDIEVMMRRVREEVIAMTGGRQVPWSNSSLVGDRVVLMPAALAVEEPTSQAPQPTPATPPSDRDGANERDIEIAYWNSVKDSRNPAFLRAYLNAYPEGSFANLARTMLNELEPAPTPETSAPVVPLPRPKPMVKLAPEIEEVVAPPAPPRIEKKPAPEPPAITRKPAQKKAVAPKPAIDKPRRKEPQKAVNTAPDQCGFCFACLSEAHHCRRTWVCGARFRDRQAQGLCNRFR